MGGRVLVQVRLDPLPASASSSIASLSNPSSPSDKRTLEEAGVSLKFRCDSQPGCKADV